MNQNLKKLLIKTKKAVFSQQIGNNTSNIKGEGYDFVELREYEDGEDIRKIDWVITAKMQKPFVKVFHTQRELDINIVPILTGSTYFGTKRFKKDTITEICSLLGYVCVAQGDSFSSFIANENAQLNTKKTKKLFGVENMIVNIDNYNPLEKNANFVNIINDLYKKIQKKSLVFLIGDFFDTNDFNLNLLAKKHEVIMIIVRDKFEENPIALGSVNFTDPNNAKTFEGDLNSNLTENYAKNVKKHDSELFKKLKKIGVQFIKIYTDDNVTQQLAKLFH